jgi:hypothetical protein
MPEPEAKAAPGALDTAQTSPALGHAIVGPAKEVRIPRDLIPAPTVLERPYEKNGSDIMAATPLARGGWRVFGTAVLIVLLAVSAYLYSRQSGKDIQTAETRPLVQAEPKAPTASAMASQVDVAVTPVDTPRASVVDADAVDKVLAADPPSAGIVYSSSEDPEAVTRRVPQPRNECEPAVATLGLCNPEAGQEKP